NDLPTLWCEGEDETSAGGSLVAWKSGHDLLQSAAPDDQFAVCEDRRGEETVERMVAGEPFGAGVDFPALLARRPVQRVKPAADVAEIDRIPGNEGGTENSIGRHLKPRFSGNLVIRLAFWLWPSGIAVRPADFALWGQLVKSRVGGGAEIDVAIHNDG